MCYIHPSGVVTMVTQIGPEIHNAGRIFPILGQGPFQTHLVLVDSVVVVVVVNT